MLWIVISVWKSKRKKSSAKPEETSFEEDAMLSSIFEKVLSRIKEDRLFLRKSFKLSELSESIQESEKLVSKSINRNTHLNFNTFINNYRVEHAKEMISSGKYDHYTIEAIADESGFSNKVSFYQAFKSNQGISPTEFKAQKQLKK